MKSSSERKPVAAWLRLLVWLGFILLVLAMPLSLAWWLMESSHQTAVKLVKQRAKFPKSNSGNRVAASSAQKESAASRGIPLAEVPLVGVYATDDLAAQKELEKQLGEIRSLGVGSRWGMQGFRAMLAKMGMVVPDTTTEADAAAEFLKQTERFSALLAQWREAVGKGPWDLGSVEVNDQGTTSRILDVPHILQYLLGAMAEARLRTGDADGAWSDLQAMNSSLDRFGDVPGYHPTSISYLYAQMLLTARTGVELGMWTDAQLLGISTMMGEANALASARRDMEVRKIELADFITHFRENQSHIQAAFSRSKSPIDKMINRIGIATATDQQIADNLAVIHYKMDLPFTRFDPDTGFYLEESAGDDFELPHSKPSDVSFDKFYYMYSEMYGGRHGWVPEQIIRSQSTIDQTRIAAALEMQHRATGEYPATLDAVSATFGDKIPRDIATGQPYFYQRDLDGGYRLWGTGIDRKSDGGDERADVTLTHRPHAK